MLSERQEQIVPVGQNYVADIKLWSFQSLVVNLKKKHQHLHLSQGHIWPTLTIKGM